MKKSEIRSLRRLLVVCLAFALTIGETTLTAFASTKSEQKAEVEAKDEDNTVVVFDEDGTVTYRTTTMTQDNSSVDSKDSIIVDNSDRSTSAKLEYNNEVSPLAASGLIAISQSQVGQNPYPYCCIIISTFPDGTILQSSGILLGKNVVLASGHGVYNHNHGGSAKTVYVGVGAYYTSSGQLEYQSGVAQRKQMIIHQNWAEQQKDTADWSLILLDSYYYFDSYPLFGYAADYTKVINRPITLIGYPSKQFCYSTGEITGTTDNKFDDRYKGLWTTSAKSAAGMSGGPMFDNGTGMVIGVVKGKSLPIFGTNVVTPITQQLSNLIKEYKYK